MAEYRAFFTTYMGVTDELTTPVGIVPLYTTGPAACEAPFKIEALWDTGAMSTFIKPALWDRLKLRPLENGHTRFAGVGGIVEADVSLVNLFLTSELMIECCPVYVADFPGSADILIGMDIIGMGDFAVCNTDGKTSFSFVVPSFPNRINFTDQAEAANKH